MNSKFNVKEIISSWYVPEDLQVKVLPYLYACAGPPFKFKKNLI